MENEILLYPNKKGLEGVIALIWMRPLIAQALNRRAGQEGRTRRRPGWARLLATCNQLKTAPPAFIESTRVPATRPSASWPAFENTKNDQNIINYAWSWLVVLALVAGTRGFSLFITLLTFSWLWSESWLWTLSMNVQISVNMSLMWKLNLECRACAWTIPCPMLRLLLFGK